MEQVNFNNVKPSQEPTFNYPLKTCQVDLSDSF